MLNNKNIELRDKLRRMKNITYEYNEYGIGDDNPEVVIWRIFIRSHLFIYFVYHIDREQHFMEARTQGELWGRDIGMDDFIEKLEQMVNELNN